MMKVARVFKKVDWRLVGPIVLLSLLGLLTIYNTSFYQGDFTQVGKQAVFIIGGLILLVTFSRFDFRVFKSNSYLVFLLYAVGILLLAGLLFVVPTRGVRGWYEIGPLTFDPVPFMSLALIIFLAKYFSQRHTELYSLKHVFASSVFALIPAALVFMQPDFGSATIILLVWLGIILVSGIRWQQAVVLFLILALLLAGVWFLALKDYQKARVLDFLNLKEVNSWNARQSLITIGAGGWWGRSIQGATQTRYGFLPEAKTDFIFAALAEEFGLLGILFILGIFAFLIYKIAHIASCAGSNFGKLFGAGFIIFIISQVFLHVGMNVGLLPIVGLSLPFISYGGSSLLTLYIGVGVMLSVQRYS